MIAKELFDQIRAAFDSTLAHACDDGKISIVLYPDGLICVNVWIGVNANRRLKLVYSTAMNQEQEFGDADWVADVVDYCTWQREHKRV